MHDLPAWCTAWLGIVVNAGAPNPAHCVCTKPICVACVLNMMLSIHCTCAYIIFALYEQVNMFRDDGQVIHFEAPRGLCVLTSCLL